MDDPTMAPHDSAYVEWLRRDWLPAMAERDPTSPEVAHVRDLLAAVDLGIVHLVVDEGGEAVVRVVATGEVLAPQDPRNGNLLGLGSD